MQECEIFRGTGFTISDVPKENLGWRPSRALVLLIEECGLIRQPVL